MSVSRTGLSPEELKRKIDSAIISGLEEIGEVVKKGIKDSIGLSNPPAYQVSEEGEWKPLSRKTISKKGHSRFLLDTGHMKDNIEFKVSETEKTVEIGFFDDRALEKARVHEKGAEVEINGQTYIIPARPFVKPQIAEKHREIMQIMQKKLSEWSS